MTEEKKTAISEILEDPKAGRLDFVNARVIAYSVAGEMANLESVVAEALETHKTSRAPEVRVRSALVAGVGLWIMRKYAEGVAALESVADDADGAYFLGLCRVGTGDCAGAIKNFHRAAQAGQDAFVCGMAEVEALRKAGNREEALAKLRTFQKTHDADAELHFQKGRCMEDAFDYEAAMESFERAVELDPQHSAALFRLAYWHDLRGNDDLALDYYEKAAAVKPVHAHTLLNLGLIYEDRGEYAKAGAAYARILAVDPTEPRARMYAKDTESAQNMFYDEAMERRQHRTAALLRVPLSEFELSARSRGCLEKMNVRTLGDLARMTEDDIAGSKNFGETSLGELRALLDSKGLHFGLGRSEPPSASAAISSPEATAVLAQPIADLDLSVRSLKCAHTLGVETVGDLTQKSEKDLLQCPNFGQTSLSEIKRKLATFGLALKPSE